MTMGSICRCAALLALFAMPANAADIHACKLSSDKRSVAVTVSNPYTQETHCTVNCHVSIPGSGVASISCTKMVPGGAKDFELCTRSRDGGAEYVRLSDAGNAECVKPLAEQKAGDKDDDDDTIDQDEILKRMQRGEPVQNWMKKK
jgi:hypothetical protein